MYFASAATNCLMAVTMMGSLAWGPKPQRKSPQRLPGFEIDLVIRFTIGEVEYAALPGFRVTISKQVLASLRTRLRLASMND